MRKRELKVSNSPTARYVGLMLERHPEHLQSDIAHAAGFTGAAQNVIMTQIKAGRTRLPLSAVGPMCKFLKEDPRPLLSIMAREYFGDLFNVYIDQGMIPLSIYESELTMSEIEAQEQELKPKRKVVEY